LTALKIANERGKIRQTGGFYWALDVSLFIRKHHLKPL